MRQNRVDPFGNFITTEARDLCGVTAVRFTKMARKFYETLNWNNGLLVRWDYKGIRRQIMAPNLLTETFFLDEATSFAAGHRPCALCRRSAFDAFKATWIKGNPSFGFDI